MGILLPGRRPHRVHGRPAELTTDATIGAALHKATIRDVDVAGKRVLVRVDFNVPIESGRIVDEAHAEADRQRGECDAYVDGKLAEFSELLATTLRTVDSGRNHLRAPATMGRNGRTALYDYQG